MMLEEGCWTYCVRIYFCIRLHLEESSGKAILYMLEQMDILFTNVLDFLFGFQALVSAVAGVIVLKNTENGRTVCQRFLKAVLHGCIMFVLVLTLEACFFVLFFSFDFLKPVRGICFSLPVLIAYALYAEFLCEFQRHEKYTLVILLFSTVVVMMEWSAPYGIVYLFAGEFMNTMVELAADLLIILFAAVIRHFSVTKYYFTKMDAVMNCVEASMVSAAAMVHECMPDVLGIEISSEVRIYIFALFMMLYAFNLLTYLFSYMMSKNRQILQRARLMEQKKTAEMQMALFTRESLQELREIRHDIKNQYFYMKSMLEAQRYQELNDFFEKFTGKISSQLFRYIDCGNQEISAVINLERLKAEREGIQMNVNVSVPEILPIESIDLCSLLTNILDNALEECSREKRQRSEKEQSAVNVVINIQGKQNLYICVINPTDKPDMVRIKKFSTSKEEKEQHGLGLYIIERIVGKYDGHFRGHIEGGRFIAEVLLNMTGWDIENVTQPAFTRKQ